MIVYPAIDIKDGKCVRLKQGRFEDITVYGDDPVEIAMRWKEKGCKYLHLVDLDGALNGTPQNIDVIKQIVKKVNIPVQIGGGVRNEEGVKRLLDLGVKRVIVGTMAINNLELLSKIVDNYSNKIAVSVDAKDGMVAIDGWVNISCISSLQLVKKLDEIGVDTIIYTDISRDGMMNGPNFDIYRQLVNNTEVDIISSGGISSLDDVEKLRDIGVNGCIIGKALYNGILLLEDLLRK